MPDRPDPPQVVQIARALDGHFAEQRDAYVEAMDSKPMGLKFGILARKDADDIVAQWMRAWGVGDPTWRERAKGVLNPWMQEVIRAAVVEGGEWIASANDEAVITDEVDFAAPDFGLDNPRAVRLLKAQAETHERGLEQMEAFTAEQVRRTLGEGLREGDGLNDMQKRVRAVYDAEAGDTGQPMRRFRAERIARTEVAQAQVESSLAGAANTGIGVRKVWLLSANPCEFCRAAAKQFSANPVELDEPFYEVGSKLRGTLGGTMDLDFRTINGPPLHPNCSCDVRMVVDGARGPVARPAA